MEGKFPLKNSPRGKIVSTKIPLRKFYGGNSVKKKISKENVLQEKIVGGNFAKEIIVMEKDLKKCVFKKNPLRSIIVNRNFKGKSSRATIPCTHTSKESYLKTKSWTTKILWSKIFVKVVQRTFSLQYNSIYLQSIELNKLLTVGLDLIILTICYNWKTTNWKNALKRNTERLGEEIFSTFFVISKNLGNSQKL